MKNKSKHIAAIILTGIISLSACTRSFENYNTDNAGFHDDLQEYDFYKYGLNALVAQKGIYFNYNWGAGVNWPFQVMQNLGADMFSGYFHDADEKFYAANSAYNLNDSWTSSNWINTLW